MVATDSSARSRSLFASENGTVLIQVVVAVQHIESLRSYALVGNTSQPSARPRAHLKIAERRNSLKHNRQCSAGRKFPGVPLRSKVSENCGAKENASENLSQDRGLPDLLHQFAYELGLPGRMESEKNFVAISRGVIWFARLPIF